MASLAALSCVACARAGDDIETKKAEAKKRILWKVDRTVGQLDEAIRLLDSIASAEGLILGKGTDPATHEFVNRFSHPSLIADYIRFTRSQEHEDDSTRLRGQLEPERQNLGQLKEGLDNDFVTPADVEKHLDEIQPTLPNLAQLAAREQVAEDLLRRARALRDEELTSTTPIDQAVELHLKERIRLAELSQKLDEQTTSTSHRLVTDAECQKLANDPEVLALFEPIVTPNGKSPWNWQLARLGLAYHDKATFNGWVAADLTRFNKNEKPALIAIERVEKAAKYGYTYWQLFRIIVQYRRDLFLTDREIRTFLATESSKRRHNEMLVRRLQLPPEGPALPPPNQPPPLEND